MQVRKTRTTTVDVTLTLKFYYCLAPWFLLWPYILWASGALLGPKVWGPILTPVERKKTDTCNRIQYESNIPMLSLSPFQNNCTSMEAWALTRPLVNAGYPWLLVLFGPLYSAVTPRITQSQNLICFGVGLFQFHRWDAYFQASTLVTNVGQSAASLMWPVLGLH